MIPPGAHDRARSANAWAGDRNTCPETASGQDLIDGGVLGGPPRSMPVTGMRQVPAPDEADGGFRVTGQRGTPIQPGDVAKPAPCLHASTDRPQVGHERRVYSSATSTCGPKGRA